MCNKVCIRPEGSVRALTPFTHQFKSNINICLLHHSGKGFILFYSVLIFYKIQNLPDLQFLLTFAKIKRGGFTFIAIN